jgi:hypothetical protein
MSWSSSFYPKLLSTNQECSSSVSQLGYCIEPCGANNEEFIQLLFMFWLNVHLRRRFFCRGLVYAWMEYDLCSDWFS